MAGHVAARALEWARGRRGGLPGAVPDVPAGARLPVRRVPGVPAACGLCPLPSVPGLPRGGVAAPPSPAWPPAESCPVPPEGERAGPAGLAPAWGLWAALALGVAVGVALAAVLQVAWSGSRCCLKR
ncbi:unnamed protein product, partial [Prorocentrum cordatum]